MSNFDLTRWGKCREIKESNLPFIDLTDGKEEPIEFLFNKDGVGLMARGNIHIIKGKRKTGKSTFASILVASALSGDFLKIKPNINPIVTLWVDTEQDKSTFKKRCLSTLRMVGISPNASKRLIRPLTLKATPLSERLSIVLKAIKEVNPDLVIIDGIVDLCNDFNNNTDSYNTLQELLSASEGSRCTILCVIHQNNKDDKARGHLGTIAEEKAAEVYTISKTNGKATISIDVSRFGENLEDIKFKFGDDFTIDSPDAEPSAEELRKELLYSQFGGVFANSVEALSHSDLCAKYKSITGCCDRTAKQSVKDALKFGILDKTGNGKGGKYSLIFSKYEESDEDL